MSMKTKNFPSKSKSLNCTQDNEFSNREVEWSRKGMNFFLSAKWLDLSNILLSHQNKPLTSAELGGAERQN